MPRHIPEGGVRLSKLPEYVPELASLGRSSLFAYAKKGWIRVERKFGPRSALVPKEEVHYIRRFGIRYGDC